LAAAYAAARTFAEDVPHGSPAVTVAPNRHIDLNTMARMLTEQKARAVDVIAGAGALECVDGNLVISGTTPQLGDDGVTMTAGTYAMNDIALKIVAPAAALHRGAAAGHPRAPHPRR